MQSWKKLAKDFATWSALFAAIWSCKQSSRYPKIQVAVICLMCKGPISEYDYQLTNLILFCAQIDRMILLTAASGLSLHVPEQLVLSDLQKFCSQVTLRSLFLSALPYQSRSFNYMASLFLQSWIFQRKARRELGWVRIPFNNHRRWGGLSQVVQVRRVPTHTLATGIIIGPSYKPKNCIGHSLQDSDGSQEKLSCKRSVVYILLDYITRLRHRTGTHMRWLSTEYNNAKYHAIQHLGDSSQ